MKRLLAVSTSLALLFGAVTIASEAPKLDGVTCPVSGKAASADHHVSYKDGNVYFCCPNCPKGFESNTAKFAAKANKQLVQTGQYVQKACPFTGKPVAEKTGENPEIGFCCKNCLGAYNKASDEEKLNKVFADGPFAKGFEKKSAE